MVDLVVVERGPVDRGIVDGVKWSILRDHELCMPRSVVLPTRKSRLLMEWR